MSIHRDFNLSEILFYKIGGKASFVLETRSRDDIIQAFDFIKNNNIHKWFVVGLGSNMLISDAPFDGAAVWIRQPDKPEISITDDSLISVYAGDVLDSLINFSFDKRFVGLENLGGLPTTVGGAIHGNAGAFGVEMKDVIEKVEVFNIQTNNTQMFSLVDCEFNYRNSIFKKNQNYIILQGFFRLKKSSQDEITNAKKTYDEKVDYREKNHPVEYPSCGSIFKNITEKEKVEKIISIWPDIKDAVETKWHGKVAMGYVTKRLGLAGMQLGGAEISKKHANYISNINNAKFSDVTTLIDKIKGGFYNTFGFYPEIEVEIIQ